jgi:acetylornithine/N-succinyldiaminopimelate aminotransferase
MTTYEELAARFEAALMPTYGIPPVALARGEGCVVWDVDGNQYLDFIAGIAVSSLGHAHPALVEAVSKQVGTIAHTSNLFLHEPEVLLAEALLTRLGHPGKVFFTNSGTEANEAAFKLVRLYGNQNGKRAYVVAADGGFHGRSMGALSITGKASIREPFAPFGTDVRFVPYGDAAALEASVDDRCAAVFLEPTQGEAGVVPPPDGYLETARQVCDATAAAFVLDEIQSGIGRTGTWFAHQHEGVLPDVMTLAKGLGGGMPIGACVGLGAFGDVFGKGDHGSTFGGNPVAAAAALSVLETIEKEGLLDHAVKAGQQLSDGLAAIQHPLLAGVRGSGLWRAAVLTAEQAPQVQAAAKQAGFLVNAVQPNAIRIAPPLIVTAGQVQQLLDAFPAILDAAQEAADA